MNARISVRPQSLPPKSFPINQFSYNWTLQNVPNNIAVQKPTQYVFNIKTLFTVLTNTSNETSGSLKPEVFLSKCATIKAKAIPVTGREGP
jgi:hypothetical protein